MRVGLGAGAGGAGGAAALPPYFSGNTYLTAPIPPNFSSSSMYAHTDYMYPFSPREDVTIDGLIWYRGYGYTANVYRGIYNAAGTLITDCATDSTVATGIHEVSTTPVKLNAGELYWDVINQSASVAGSSALSGGAYDEAFANGVYKNGLALDVIGTLTSSEAYFAMGSVRANYRASSLPSSQTLTSLNGPAFNNVTTLMGFTKQ